MHDDMNKGYASQESDVDELNAQEYTELDAADMELTGVQAVVHHTEV